MQTIEIDYRHFVEDEALYLPKIHVLMTLLQKHILTSDSSWHFMIQPEVIIRVSDEYVEKVIEYLKSANYIFTVYSYPLGQGTYTLQTVNVDVRYENLFLPVYHANTLAALELSEPDYIHYIERTLTTMINMRYFSREKQAKYLLLLAMMNFDMSEEIKLFTKVFSKSEN